MKHWVRKVEIFWIGFALFAGLFALWVSRYKMNPDGISYIEIGEAYWRGDFTNAFNAWWSPLYSWILGGVLLALKPSSYWEFPIVHGVNFLIYIFSLFSFSLFLKKMIPPKDESSHFIFVSLVYTLFIISSLHVITLSLVTPDLLVAGFVYLMAGLLLRIRENPALGSPYVAFGIISGLGYLAKTPLFLLAFVAYALILAFRGDFKKTLISFVIFLSISLPYIFFISEKKGSITVGDSGPVNYAWYVNGAAHHVHWQGDKATGVPEHTTRKIFNSPAIFEFASPIAGSYPPWYDPSYWYKGIHPTFDAQEQIQNIYRNAREYWALGLKYFWPYFILFCAVLIFDRSFFLQDGQGKIIIFALAGLFLYLPVLVQGRYVAPFMVLLIVGALSSLLYEHAFKKLLAFLCLGTLVGGIVWVNASNLVASVQESRYVHWEVARELSKTRVERGDQVAFVGNEFSGLAAFWAHLAGVRIIAEMPSSSENKLFWKGDKNFQLRVVDIFRHTGAKAVIAEPAPYYQTMPGWRELGNTGYYMYTFNGKG